MRTIDVYCLYCKRPLKEGDAIYVVNAKLERYNGWGKSKFIVTLSNSKNPKGGLHRHCWNNLFGLAEDEEENGKTVPQERDRLKTIE